MKIQRYGDDCEWPAFSHRDTFGIATLESPRYQIDGVPVFCVLLIADYKWWIANRFTDQDRLWTDMGPYDTSEIAFMMMKLTGTKE